MSINVDLDALVNSANELNLYKNNIMECLQNAQQTIIDVNKIWDSDGGYKFYTEQMRFLTTATDACETFLSSYIDFLNIAADSGYKSTEMGITKKASSFN